jgi:hypothetical protein
MEQFALGKDGLSRISHAAGTTPSELHSDQRQSTLPFVSAILSLRLTTPSVTVPNPGNL